MKHLTLQSMKNRMRRGSALLLVVVLVLLLAMMGTAFLVAARLSRDQITGTGSAQIILPADRWWPSIPAPGIDGRLQTQATSTLAAGEEDVRSVLYTTGWYRRPTALDSDVTATSLAAGQAYLASRVPYEPFQPNQTIINDFRWAFISQLSTLTLDNPLVAANTTLPGVAAPPPNPLSGRQDLQIGSVAVTYPVGTYNAIRSLSGRTRVYPALIPAGGGAPQLAADADGDGIADAGLCRVTAVPADMVTCQDGLDHPITYWAGVRIIDNAGAVNFNTAWSRDDDFVFTFAAPGNPEPNPVPAGDWRRGLLGTFRSNVGLTQLFTAVGGAAMRDHDIRELNRWRMDFAAGADPFGGSRMANDDLTLQPATILYITQGDALENGLGRRLSNPALNVFDPATPPATWVHYRVFDNTVGYDDLCYRFGLIDSRTGTNPLRDMLTTTAIAANTVNDTRKFFRYYGANQFDYWFYTAMEWDGARRDRFFPVIGASANYMPGAFGPSASVPVSLRSLLVMNNPISNRVAFHDLAWSLLPATSGAIDGVTTTDPVTHRNRMIADPAVDSTPRASANTAGFEQIWKSYWEVMIGETGASLNPATGVDGSGIGLYQFRSPLRAAAATTYMDGPTVALLRSAIAANNLVALRDPDIASGRLDPVTGAPTANPVLARQLPCMDTAPGLPATHFMRAFSGGPPAVAADVRVTVYGQQQQPFITEIYANTDNETGGPAGNNPNGYIAVEIFNPYPTGTDLTVTDYHLIAIDRATMTVTDIVRLGTLAGLTTIPGGNVAGSRIVIDNLTGAAPGAVRLPSDAATTATLYHTIALNSVYNRELVIVRPVTTPAAGAVPANLDGWAPVDSFDFTGLTVLPKLTPGDPNPKTIEAWHYVRPNNVGNEWRCVYPGQYNRAVATRHQEGTAYKNVTVRVDQPGEFDNGANPTWSADAWWRAGAVNPAVPPTATLGLADAAATWDNAAQDFTYIIPLNLPGWPTPNTPGVFPFGLFARDGDLLQVPFIGGYRVTDPTGATLQEFTAITMDAAFADDQDDTPVNNHAEQLGRFIPVAVASGGAFPGVDQYAWCNKLFGYLTTIQNPADDYTPNVAPSRYAGATAVANRIAGTANGGAEDDVPIQGKININTAPWQVLAMLPMTNDPDENRRLAKAIVRFRDVDGDIVTVGNQPHGPFRSIMELNLVPSYLATELDDTAPSRLFAAATGQDPTVVDFGPDQGDLQGPDGIVSDFKQRMAAVTRISNLITTRSDSFTVYTVVQAWMDAGTAYPVMVGEQRNIAVVDRSRLGQIVQAYSGVTPAPIYNPTNAVAP